MIAIAVRILGCVVAAGVVVACAQLLPPGASDTAGRLKQADELVEQGDLAGALVQLRVLEMLRPNDPEITRKRASVEVEAERLAERRYEQAETELRRNSRQAYRDYLAVLAYDPRHEGALRRLRQLELQRNRANRPGIGGPVVPTMLAKPETPVQMAGPVKDAQIFPRNIPKPRPKPEPPAARLPAVDSGSGGNGADTNVSRRPPAVADGSDGNDERTKVARQPPPADDAGNASKKRAAAAEDQSVELAVATAKAGTYLNLIEYAEAYLASHPEDDKAMELLALSHEKAGLALYQDGKLRQSLRHLEFAVAYSGDPQGASATALAAAKTRLADETFKLGVRAFRDDITQAIAYWEETLTYDPGHAKAKQFLSKAYRIRDTLNEISSP